MPVLSRILSIALRAVEIICGAVRTRHLPGSPVIH